MDLVSSLNFTKVTWDLAQLRGTEGSSISWQVSGVLRGFWERQDITDLQRKVLLCCWWHHSGWIDYGNMTLGQKNPQPTKQTNKKKICTEILMFFSTFGRKNTLPTPILVFCHVEFGLAKTVLFSNMFFSKSETQWKLTRILKQAMDLEAALEAGSRTLW